MSYTNRTPTEIPPNCQPIAKSLDKKKSKPVREVELGTSLFVLKVNKNMLDSELIELQKCDKLSHEKH